MVKTKGRALAKRPKALPTEEIDIVAITAQLSKLASPKAVKAIADKAQALSVYYGRSRGGVQAVNRALELALRADRRLGQLLEGFKRGRGRPSKEPDDAEKIDPRSIFVRDEGIDGPHIKRWQKLAGLPEETFEEYVRSVKAKGEKLTYAGAVGTSASEREGYDGDEHYTPPRYVEAVRRVLGQIDLDPATCEAAQQRIGALSWHTKEDNGLDQEWIGRVFLNPPFSEGSEWATKLLAELEAGNTTAAIFLQNSATDTKWFHALAREAACVCFVLGRINFIRPDGESEANRSAQTFFYFGDEVETFRKVFAELGLVGRLDSVAALETSDEDDESAAAE